MSEHWLNGVLDLLNAETTNLRELAKLANADPRTFYLGANLEGVNISGQDLRGMRFSEAELGRVIANRATKLDDDLVPWLGVYVAESNSKDLSFLEWALDWNKRWQQLLDDEPREALADEATEKLTTHEPDNEVWLWIWQRLWSFERRDDPRRILLYEAAINFLAKLIVEVGATIKTPPPEPPRRAGWWSRRFGGG